MKKILSLLFALLLVFTLCSCGVSKADECEVFPSNSGYSYADRGEAYDSPTAQSKGGDVLNKIAAPSLDAEATKNENAVSQKVIYRVYLELETKNYDEAVSQIKGQAEAFGGYISERNEYNRSSSRYVSLTVRVPAASLSSYTDSVSRDCNVLSNRLSTEDITDSYYNLKSRMDSLVEQEARLNKLLEKADTLEYLLKIENELSNVRSQINELNYRIQIYDKSVDYSYVYITLNEVVEYQPMDEQTFWQKIGTAFKNGFEALGTVWQWIAVALSWLIPFLAPVAIVVAVILYFVIRRKKTSKKDDENKE